LLAISCCYNKHLKTQSWATKYHKEHKLQPPLYQKFNVFCPFATCNITISGRNMTDRKYSIHRLDWKGMLISQLQYTKKSTPLFQMDICIMGVKNTITSRTVKIFRYLLLWLTCRKSSLQNCKENWWMKVQIGLYWHKFLRTQCLVSPWRWRLFTRRAPLLEYPHCKNCSRAMFVSKRSMSSLSLNYLHQKDFLACIRIEADPWWWL